MIKGLEKEYNMTSQDFLEMSHLEIDRLLFNEGIDLPWGVWGLVREYSFIELDEEGYAVFNGKKVNRNNNLEQLGVKIDDNK